MFKVIDKYGLEHIVYGVKEKGGDIYFLLHKGYQGPWQYEWANDYKPIGYKEMVMSRNKVY